MTDVVALDAMPREEAAELLRACCGSTAWVERMLARRPFRTPEMLVATADELWRSVDEADWREAFAHHPRLGEATSPVTQGALARGWSSGEQSGARTAGDDVRAALAAANRAYDACFGYTCIICATGKSADELLAITRGRLSNDPATEIRVAAEEQRKIMRLRLKKLLATSTGGASR